MGSKSSKWLMASLVVASLAAFPAGAGARLDYSRNAVSGEVQGTVPTRLDYSRNSVSGEYLPPRAHTVQQPTGTHRPVAPSQSSKAVAPAAKSDSGFSWGDAFVGAGVALLLAFGGVAIVRRRHPTPLAG